MMAMRAGTKLRRSRAITLMLAVVTAFATTPAMTQSEATRIPSHCQAIAEGPGPERLHRTAFGAPIAENRVRISFVDHAMFLIETPGGLSAITDYSGFIGSTGHAPTVATMNIAHRTHWTDQPDPRIAHVLQGWAAEPHDLDLGEMRIRNVQTDIRSGTMGPVARANSIFIFEVAGLCVGHLGHLHHIPDDAQFAEIGRLDVVMVPVDGGYTMDVAAMSDVVTRLRSSVVLPMHWFSGRSLEIFLDRMEEAFEVVRLEQNHIELGLHMLPGRPTIIVLQPEWLR